MKFLLLWTFLSLPAAFAFDPDTIGDTQPPYLVYLKSDYLPCTGVLIHPLWVLTAAHCNLPRLQVVLGITNPSNSTERNVQMVGYEKMIHHPQFLVSSIEYDLMLIKLNRLVELNNYVNVVNLPKSAVKPKMICDVSTWAYNFCEMAKDPDNVQNVDVSVISPTECQKTYPAYKIRNNMICVGIVPGRRQPCKVTYFQCLSFPIFFLVSLPQKIISFLFFWQEISAAPAVCNGVLHGILSYTDGCILRADVGIYSSIFHYLPWIEETIKNN
ncbi:serine protease 58 isoform X1 [Octodon degus]|uniref:Serine protease 58 isoform X1 n=1 Tax=Octodon degus TaxID=10160 RepID=A0A6P6E9D1_OCTDE|nr:serine protease 58 isoform X1 [Octodon degus]